MMKTLQHTLKMDKERFEVPRSVQQTIPIRRIWPDGIFLVGTKYSKTYRFTDINYAIASKDDKTGMFLGYSELLNSLDSGASTKITICNRRLNRNDFEKSILIPYKSDELDEYKADYNNMLLDKAADSNNIRQDRYITISIHKKNVEEARNYFARIGVEITNHLAELSSYCTELDAGERLRIFHDFFRTGEETHYHFDLKAKMRNGHGFKDFICPDTLEFRSDHFVMGEKFGRVLFLRDYANYLKDSFVSELCDLNKNLFYSIDILPIPMDEAVQEIETKLLGVETNIANFQRKQNQNNNFSSVIPYDLERQREEAREFLNDLVSRDQRMMFAVQTMTIIADSKEALDADTETLLSIGRKHLCQLAVLKYQQLDGLNTVLPYGLRKIDSFRTLSTEALAVFMPFRAQDISHEGGIYYGRNVISRNLIMVNPEELQNSNSFIMGLSGSGKSMVAKEIIFNYRAKLDYDVIIIDPEREYHSLVKALLGQTIFVSATSNSHINAMDISREYGDGNNPVILKSEFILSLCEQLIGHGNLGPRQKSIIDRCTANVYRKLAKKNFEGTMPTLQDFYAELLRQPEEEAKEVALAIELFTSGSLNTFAKPTNVDVDNALICYDILDLGKQLQPLGMLVVLDSIFNRIIKNRQKGRRTAVFIDEIYLLFMHEYSANFLYTTWKRARKYGASCHGITQNVSDLLESHTAKAMLANSENVVLLNQASTDRIELAKLLNISDLQLSYITNAEVGTGLLKVGNALVPFNRQMPKNKLYSLMTTRPGEY